MRASRAVANGLAAPMVAVGFLTVIPIPLPSSVALGPMGWAIACFPLVGAAVGGLAGAVGLSLSGWLPPSVLAAIVLVTALATTGALHLDGLMDCCDGLFGGKDRDSRMAIMKDSRVGSFGIAAAVSVLLLEYGAIAALSPESGLRALVAAGALSRGAMAVALAAFPAAGATGIAAGLKPQLRWYHAAVAALLAVVMAAGVVGAIGLAASAAVALLVAAIGGLAKIRIGGITGDVCGGIGQLAEAVVLVLTVGMRAG